MTHQPSEIDLDLISPNQLLERLPAELWVNIFHQCFQKCAIRIGVTREAPFSFTQVCRWWRHIALSTAILWTNIHIDLNSNVSCRGQFGQDPKSINEEGVKGLLSLILERSQGLKLNIAFRGGQDESFDLTMQCLELLLSHSHHWHTAAIVVCVPRPDGFSSRHTFPLLKEMKLDFSWPTSEFVNDATSSPIPLFLDAPLLTKLTVAAYSTDPNNLLHAYQLPWVQLTDLYLSIKRLGNPVIIVDILRHTTNLAALKIMVEKYAYALLDHAWETRDRPVLPFLRVFSAYTAPGDWLFHSPFMTHFSAPQLEELNVILLSDSIDNLLRESQCKLRRLYVGLLGFSGKQFDADQLTMFFKEFGSQLRSLTVLYPGPDPGEYDQGMLMKEEKEEFQTLLEQKMAVHNFLPQLAELKIVMVVYTDDFAVPTGIEALVRARSDLKVHIECTLARGDMSTSNRRAQEMRRMCEEVGCSVHFKDHPQK